MPSNERTTFVGLDLGQAADYTAVAVVERREEGTGEWEDYGPRIKLIPVLNAYGYGHGEHRVEEVGRILHEKTTTHLNIRHLERLPLGTAYPDVVRRVATLLALPDLAGAELVVDATGVGRPVVDMLHAAGLYCTAVTITGGSTVTDNGWAKGVPKRDLVSALQIHQQAGRLKVSSKAPEVATLVRELLAFKVKITDAGNDTYGTRREGSHDDLVLAVALACWKAERPTEPLFY